ncbi:Uma2 family endonuclease [Alkalihalobacillus sp. BA299]|uniref:Uma2 family endonuclease n=1 Tax=Alkalihalobacillus sp. BA299 TaxID=2815938 RepID=UPI001ADA972F|nr:Uma2 family endonuclease [Alkalihalobacillus sp. BA299]
MSLIQPNQKYTYGDYLKWDNEQKWEIIDGTPYCMTPAPSTQHQKIVRELLIEFGTFLRGKKCQIFAVPFDVRLSYSEKDDEVNNVVQPDLSIICDKSKLDERGCKGAPDLVIEVLSPGSSAKRDKLSKYNLYQSYGVKEYWIVDPHHENVEVFLLVDDHFSIRDVYSREDTIEPQIFQGFEISLDQIF